MSDNTLNYIHGYSHEEQTRLIKQAEYWREDLILRDINYVPQDKILELGCGVGAVLGIIGRSNPELQLSGIDLEEKQINYARQYINNLGLNNIELVVGDAHQLPWDDNSFDRIYTMWFLEHISDSSKIIQEAKRVLKDSGTISLTETDYRSLVVSPESEDFLYLRNSLCELFQDSGGNYSVGQNLDSLLIEAGFDRVENKAITFRYFNNGNSKNLRSFIEYINSWLAPIIPEMIARLNKNPDRLFAGLNWFQNLPDLPGSSATIVIYRGLGTKVDRSGSRTN